MHGGGAARNENKDIRKSVKSVKGEGHLNVQVNIMGVMTGTEIALERMKKVIITCLELLNLESTSFIFSKRFERYIVLLQSSSLFSNLKNHTTGARPAGGQS